MKRRNRFVVFIIMFAVTFGTVFSANIAQAAKLPTGSTIAGISIEGLSPDEARDKLLKEIESWKAKESFAVKSNQEIFLIPRSSLHFQIENTLNEMESKTKRRWYTFFTRPKNVHLPIEVTFESDIEWPEYIDEKATAMAVEEIAAQFGEQAKIVYEKDKEIKRVEISEVTFEVPKTSDTILGHLVDKLNELVIEPKERFSFIESVLEPLNITRSSEEVNFVATALYALVLKSNIDIIERHSQSVIPSYAQAGVEVKVNLIEKKDLKFYSDEHYSYNVQAERRDNQLVMSLHAPAKEMSYNYRVENQNEMKPRTVYRYSSELNPGEEQTIRAGSKGLKVEVYRDQLSDTDSVVESTLISRDYYPPKPAIVLVSAQGSAGNQNSLDLENGEDGAENQDIADPYLAMEEIEQQFQDFIELFSLLSIFTDVMNSDELTCEDIKDEEARTLCDEMKSEVAAAKQSSEETAQ